MTESARKRITIDFSGNDSRLQAIYAHLTRANLSREMTIEALVAHYLPVAMLLERGKLSDKELLTIGYQSLDRLLGQINSLVDLYSLEGLPFPIDGLARRVSFLGQLSQPLAVTRAVNRIESVGDDLDDREDDEEVVLIPPQRASNFSGLK
jgi:signal transduction histidine kinase